MQGLQLFLKASEAEIAMVQDEDEELARKKEGEAAPRRGSAEVDIGSGLSLRAKVSGLVDLLPTAAVNRPLLCLLAVAIARPPSVSDRWR